jgi:DNA-binding transcriptional MerR regulator
MVFVSPIKTYPKPDNHCRVKPMANPELSIGALARGAGVSVQTLRHYDALGLLRPSRITTAGYRLYSPENALRLDLIRTLRDAGFDLAAIGALLEGQVAPRSALALQLGVLEAQMRDLRRRRSLLTAVMRGDDATMLTQLQRVNALAKLGRFERETFLAAQLGSDAARTQGDPRVWEAAVMHLPETLDEAQLEDWLELAQIAADAEFQRNLHEQLRLFEAIPAQKMQRWSALHTRIQVKAAEMLAAGVVPSDEEAQRLLTEWLRGLARTFARRHTPGFERLVRDKLEALDDPKLHRYWALVARLKNLPPSTAQTRSAQWLLEALRFRVDGQP